MAAAPTRSISAPPSAPSADRSRHAIPPPGMQVAALCSGKVVTSTQLLRSPMRRVSSAQPRRHTRPPRRRAAAAQVGHQRPAVPAAGPAARSTLLAPGAGAGAAAGRSRYTAATWIVTVCCPMLTAGVSAELLPAGGGAPARGTRLARAPQQRPTLEGPGRGADTGRVAQRPPCGPAGCAACAAQRACLPPALPCSVFACGEPSMRVQGHGGHLQIACWEGCKAALTACPAHAARTHAGARACV